MTPLLLVALALTGFRPEAEPVPDNPREKLETAIPHGIKLLEGKKYVEFLKAYGPPDWFKGEAEVLDKIAAGFGKEKAPTLLAVLKEIKGTKPKLNEAGTEATFGLKKKVDGRDTIKFRKAGKFWHVGN